MARTKIDSQKTERMKVEPRPVQAPSVTVAETGLASEIPLVNQAPVMLAPAMKVESPSADEHKRYKVVTAGYMSVRGCMVHLTPGMIVSDQYNDIETMRKSVRLEEV